MPQVGLLIKYKMTGPGEDWGFDSLWLEIEHDPFYSPAESVLSFPILIGRGGSVF